MTQVLARVAQFVAACFRRLGRAIRRHPFVAATIVPLVAIVVAGVLTASYIASLVPLTPSVDDIASKARSEHPTVVLTADGKTLVTFRHVNRRWVKLADISPNVVNALLATEDHRFYEHN
ncbi:MAG TPA: transglycosylase domain-containing protein, partial [Ramlibacter sp.]|nr:transglycosylase domain-containing protein [Ramlibacter sp.]